MPPLTNAEAFASWLLHNKAKVAVLILLLLSVSALGLIKTKFSNDYRVYFEDDNPQLVAFDKLQNTYTRSDNVLIVVTPEKGNVFDDQVLMALTDITKQAWQIPHSIRVDSLTNYQYSHAEGDELIVRDLVSSDSLLLREEVKQIRDIALAEPALVNRLISPSGHVTGINVSVTLPEGVLEKVVIDHVRTMLSEAEIKYPYLRFDVTGMVPMSNVFPEAAETDIKTLVPLMFAFVFIGLRLFFGSIIPTVITGMVIGISNMVAIGLASGFGIVLSPVSVSAPTIIMTIAVADCVHIVNSYIYHLRNGFEKDAAIIESFKGNLKPIFITSITTTIGFFSMNFSESPPFRDLGNIVAAGVIAAFIFSLTILPILLSLIPLKSVPKISKTNNFIRSISEIVIQNPTKILTGCLMLSGSLLFLATDNELDDNFVEYFDESIEFRRASDYTMDNLTGLNLIEYSLSTKTENGISNPAYLEKVEAFSQWYRTQPEVLHVSSFTDLMKRLNQNVHDNDPAFYRTPKDRELASQNLLLYELSLPYGLDLNNQISFDKSSTRVTVLLNSISTRELLALERRAQSWFTTNAPELQNAGASPTIMFGHVGEDNIRGMFKGTFLALIIITMMIAVMLRSTQLGVISLFVNIIPSIMAFGVWSLLVGKIGVAASVVVSMTLGIVVDDTVHFLTKYLHAKRELNMDTNDAIRYSYGAVGSALFITSAVLVAGFSILSQSGFTANGDMGILTAITIAIALLVDLLLLPAVIITVNRLGSRNSPAKKGTSLLGGASIKMSPDTQ